MVEGLGSSTIIEPHPESCHDSALFLFDALLQHSFTEQIYMYILIQIPRSPGGNEEGVEGGNISLMTTTSSISLPYPHLYRHTYIYVYVHGYMDQPDS